jgi:hypothetical protein
MRKVVSLVLAACWFQASHADPIPTDCPITRPPDGRVGSEALSVLSYGRFRFEPGGSGFVDRDGALGIKVGWIRHATGKLNVGGRRLDGDAAPARAYVYDYGESGFQPTYLVFPTPGCWEIAAVVGDHREQALTFVVFVELIGDGPSWRFEGLEPGWRVSKLSRETL